MVPSLDGITLVRTRGYFRVVLDTVSAASSGFSGAFGIGLASLAAVTAGIASVPTPITEQEDELWLYWSAFSVSGVTATIADGVNAQSVEHFMEIDSKAMRKFEAGMAMYAAVEVVEIGAASMFVWHDSRMLFKLP